MRTLTKLRRGVLAAFQAVSLFLFMAVGHLRRLRRYTRKTWKGKDPVRNSQFEAVYVHFDRYGVVHDYVIEQLRELVAAGYRITFVTNSPEFEDRSLADVIPFCRQIVWRHNVGYDFGAYKDGIAAIGSLDRVTRVILMNDSVYGPFRSLASVLAPIDPDHVDVWGITDSWEQHYHVQSYFVMFLGAALRSSAFLEFWKRMPYLNQKSLVIRRGEVRLTQVLTRRKLRVSVLCPYWTVARRILDKLAGRSGNLPNAHAAFLDSLHNQLVHGAPMNGLHFFWDTLISDFGCPFLKREVILSNPADVPYSWRWEEVITASSNYDGSAIRRHLQAF